MQNFTPLKTPDLSSLSPKTAKRGFSKKLAGILVAFVLMAGVVSGYFAMQQGYIFKQRAAENCFDPKTLYGNEAAWNPHFLEFFDWNHNGFDNKNANASVSFTYKGAQPLCNPLKFVLLTYKGTGDTLATSLPQTLNSYAEVTISNESKSGSMTVAKPSCGNTQVDFSLAVNPSSCTNGNCPFDVHGKDNGVWGVYGDYQSTKNGGTIEYPGGRTVSVPDVAVACTTAECFDPTKQYHSEAEWNPHFQDHFRWSNSGFDTTNNPLNVTVTYDPTLPANNNRPLCPLKFVLTTFQGSGPDLQTSMPQTLFDYAEVTLTNDKPSATFTPVNKPSCYRQLDFNIDPLNKCTRENGCPLIANHLNDETNKAWGIYGFYQGSTWTPPGGTSQSTNLQACSETPTPPNACVVPSAVKNVKVTCPLCTAQ